MKVNSLDTLQNMWKKDSKIDYGNLGIEAAKGPSLHSKYLNIMTNHNMMKKKYEIELKKKRKFKWRWYSGKLDDEELKEHNLEQQDLLTKDVQMFIDTDEDIILLQMKVTAQDEVVQYCQSVIKALYDRTWAVRNAIEWEKFSAGR